MPATPTAAQLHTLRQIGERDGWNTIYRFRRPTIGVLLRLGLIERSELSPCLIRKRTTCGTITVAGSDYTIRLTDAGRSLLEATR